MSEVAEAELIEIGRDAARVVAGDDAVERVAVAVGQDYMDRPAYHFSFLIDPARTRKRMGMVYIQLAQKLRDALIGRNDDHYPYVQLLSRADWEQRERA